MLTPTVEYIIIGREVMEAVRTRLAGWETDQVPLKLPNELDLLEGSARCRTEGSPWIRVSNHVARTWNAGHKVSSKQSGTGYVRFSIFEPLANATGISDIILQELGGRMVGETVGPVIFRSGKDNTVGETSEDFQTNLDVIWDYQGCNQ